MIAIGNISGACVGLLNDKRRLYEDINWYYTSKNYALKQALQFLEPLTAEDKTALRFYYSQYFSNLCSAMEVVLKSPFGEIFRSSLMCKLTTAKATGKKNFLYLRELRNSLVHRGEDITSSAVFHQNLPLLIAPKVRDRLGAGNFLGPSHPLVLQIINECEESIGVCISAYIDEFDPRLPALSLEEARKEAILDVAESGLIPEAQKNFALKFINSDFFVRTLDYPLAKLHELLRQNFLYTLARSNPILKEAIYE